MPLSLGEALVIGTNTQSRKRCLPLPQLVPLQQVPTETNGGMVDGTSALWQAAKPAEYDKYNLPEATWYYEDDPNALQAGLVRGVGTSTYNRDNITNQ